jgi:hypothetical protein
MAATHDLVNPGATAVTGWGGSAVNVPARSVAIAQTLTDAQAIAGAVTANGAALPASISPALRKEIILTILDAEPSKSVRSGWRRV